MARRRAGGGPPHRRGTRALTHDPSPGGAESRPYLWGRISAKSALQFVRRMCMRDPGGPKRPPWGVPPPSRRTPCTWGEGCTPTYTHFHASHLLRTHSGLPQSWLGSPTRSSTSARTATARQPSHDRRHATSIPTPTASTHTPSFSAIEGGCGTSLRASCGALTASPLVATTGDVRADVCAVGAIVYALPNDLSQPLTAAL